MKNQQSILTQPSLMSNAHNIPCSEPTVISQFEKHRPQEIKILKYVSDVYDPLGHGHQKSEGLQSEAMSSQLTIAKKMQRNNNPVFKTFGGRSESQNQESQQMTELNRETKAELIFNYEVNQKEDRAKHSKYENKKKTENTLLKVKKHAQQQKQQEQNQPPWYSEFQKNINMATTCQFLANSKNREKGQLKISKTKIAIGPIGLQMSKILKIKIFPSVASEESAEELKIQKMELSNYRESSSQYKETKKVQKENTIKLTMENNETFNFSQRYPVLLLSEPKEAYSPSLMPCPESPSSGLSSRLPLPYLTFAKIILKKLKQLYPNLKSTEWLTPEFPIRPMIRNGVQTKNYGFIHGRIYKKSQHKLKWEKRYVIVNEKGIYSFKQEKDEDFSFQIGGRSIKYMWTWFTILNVDKQKDKLNLQPQVEKKVSKKMTDQLKKSDKQSSRQSQNEVRSTTGYKQSQNPYLIVKLKHGFNGQTEFAIPICGFDNEKNKAKNWLFAFYKLMSNYEY